MPLLILSQQLRNELAEGNQSPCQILCHGLHQCTMENCLQTFRADGTKIKNDEKVPLGRRKWNCDTAAVLNFRIILNALLKGNHPPRFLRKKASPEPAEAESTSTLKSNPKFKRVRKNTSSPASSLQKKQRTG
ncbi:hypothetical protein BX661DRAFT_205168 [Kickxella alabastrina]|uniref:uncharacterized protein n=1 Tax=Kickxella alabastrina TaxID=61397 RepID=UPI00221F7802|nr:uncharacterized protein BX661DRAFT_205168 [Kickxella alabastrina]KAI7828346.1 hypothetical protein BX661DRAFT_205168 [Kickxella alabastrina]